MEEEWRTLVLDGKETHFLISSYGRIKNLKTQHWKHGGMLKPKLNKTTGYYRWTISINNVQTDYYVHRLVAETFIPNPQNKEQVNHIDGDKSNNCVDNLEWTTPKENTQHAFNNGLVPTEKAVIVYKINGEYVGNYKSITEASKRLGVSLNIGAKCSHDYQVFLEEEFEKAEDVSKTCKRMNIGVVQLTMDGQFVAYYDSLADALHSLGITKGGMISAVCKGKRKSYHGYKWMYAEDYYRK